MQIQSARPNLLLETSAPVDFLDYLRVPHEVKADAGALVWVRGANGALGWVSSFDVSATAGDYRFGEIRLFCRLAPDRVVEDLVDGRWHRAEPIVDADGSPRGSVWRSNTGDTLLPFDPDEVVLNYLSERWVACTGKRGVAAKRWAMRMYYWLRPLFPRRLQIAMRRRFSRLQARTQFPRWPLETALHDLYDRLLDLLADVAAEPIPYIAPWPAPFSWALVLTHDVEHEEGLRRIPEVRDVELELGYRSAWYLVPERDYQVDDSLVDQLRTQGFEVGVHGLRHDGRDLASAALVHQRLPSIRRWANRWDAVGFRSPATHRNWDLMPVLGFDYDSSSFDTDPFEPQAGGCCTWWPFFNQHMVELPITLTMDHTLFVILRRDESLWLEKARLLRERGGAAVLLTHPDYLDADRLAAYARVLRAFADDPTAWRALPREVCEWWRRRAASTLVRAGNEWRVEGPAKTEAAIAVHRL